jgi:predicted amidophosphoribosyltransferase
LPGGLVVHRRWTGPVRAAMPYDAAGSAVVRAWKLGGRRDLTATLGGLVADAVAHASPRQGRGVVLVPVPVRPASRRRRGEDLVARLALHAARALPGACVVPALRWSRRVGEQVGLDPAQRARNMAASMVAEALPTGEVWVLDDVLTTGATLGEALRALQCRGARDLRPVALAAVVGFDAARPGRGLLPCPAPSGRDSLDPG